MTLKYTWRSFQPRLWFPRPFQQSLACFRVARSPSNSWASCREWWLEPRCINVLIYSLQCVWLSAVALPPTTPVVSDICYTSCRVNYQPPDIQADGPPVIGYFLEARTSDGPTWIRVNKIPITGTEVGVKKLRWDTRYEFRVSALNDNGCGEYSTPSAAVVPFTENRPSQPGRPVATVSATSVKLEWSMLGGYHETEHFRYVIRCREANRKGPILYPFTERKAGTTIHHTLSNRILKSETQYEFAVAACNGTRLGPFSTSSDSVETAKGSFLHFVHCIDFNCVLISRDLSSVYLVC